MLSIEELGKVYGCTHAHVISFITHTIDLIIIIIIIKSMTHTYQNICSVILLKFRHHISHYCTLTLANLVLMLSRLSLISSLSPPTGASLLRNSSH